MVQCRSKIILRATRFEIKKKLINSFICGVAVCGSETGTVGNMKRVS